MKKSQSTRLLVLLAFSQHGQHIFTPHALARVTGRTPRAVATAMGQLERAGLLWVSRTHRLGGIKYGGLSQHAEWLLEALLYSPGREDLAFKLEAAAEGIRKTA